jgi:hypothetical protein
VTLIVGSSEEDRVQFTPVAAMSEYVELPGLGNEFRITLAGYAASCDKFVPPGPGQASVSVVVVTPAGKAPTPGDYAWAGHDAHGGTSASPERAYALPSARIGRKSYVFPPGGLLSITSLRLLPQGEVEGQLAFEFPGAEGTPERSIKGSFRADICRYDEAPFREKPGETLRP